MSANKIMQREATTGVDHAGPPFCALDQQEPEEIEAHRGPYARQRRFPPPRGYLLVGQGHCYGDIRMRFDWHI